MATTTGTTPPPRSVLPPSAARRQVGCCRRARAAARARRPPSRRRRPPAVVRAPPRRTNARGRQGPRHRRQDDGEAGSQRRRARRAIYVGAVLEARDRVTGVATDIAETLTSRRGVHPSPPRAPWLDGDPQGAYPRRAPDPRSERRFERETNAVGREVNRRNNVVTASGLDRRPVASRRPSRPASPRASASSPTSRRRWRRGTDFPRAGREERPGLRVRLPGLISRLAEQHPLLPQPSGRQQSGRPVGP